MKFGKMRHRVTIQKLTRTDDGAGGYTETWEDIATVWAAVEPLSGREYYLAQQTQAEVSHKVTMRYGQWYDEYFLTPFSSAQEGETVVKPQMRIVYDGRPFSFDIQSVIDVKERHRELVVLCKEVVE